MGLGYFRIGSGHQRCVSCDDGFWPACVVSCGLLCDGLFQFSLYPPRLLSGRYCSEPETVIRPRAEQPTRTPEQPTRTPRSDKVKPNSAYWWHSRPCSY